MNSYCEKNYINIHHGIIDKIVKMSQTYNMNNQNAKTRQILQKEGRRMIILNLMRIILYKI